MIDQGKKPLLGIEVNAVDYEACVETVTEAAREGRSLLVSAMAVHGLMTGVLDPCHRYRLNRFDLLVPDGQPVRWALNILHKTELPDRVYGPRLTLEVCRAAAQLELPVYFYGSRQDVLDRLVANLTQRFPGLTVAGAEPSLFRTCSPSEMEEIAGRIRQSGAKIVFVGLGCPRQEVWAYEYRELLPLPSIAVGAAFDFHAGTLAQAPPLIQDWGLEWLFRLSKEPGRLWKRYLTLNPLFSVCFVLQWAFGSKLFPREGKPPSQQFRYG